MSENKGVPYIGFGNDTLFTLPTVVEGQVIQCPQCKGSHALECATDTETGEKSSLAMFYICGEKAYLGAINGRLTTAQRPDVSGEL